MACFLEVVLAGTTDNERLVREKVRLALARNAGLAARILSAKTETTAHVIWVPEMDRVRNVVLKLARGHAAFELRLAQLDEPSSIDFQPFESMSERASAEFERAGAGEWRGWPEIGSRAFMRACGRGPSDDSEGPWVVVQAGRYRYSVDHSGGVVVRIVLSEYLACHVQWE